MSNVIETLERRQLREVPRFKAGDTVRVHFKVIEGARQRIQVFEGIVIKRQGAGARETFTVRKNSFGVGVERTFPLHSPKIDKLEVMQIGDVDFDTAATDDYNFVFAGVANPSEVVHRVDQATGAASAGTHGLGEAQPPGAA